jgi:hypothetical protein
MGDRNGRFVQREPIPECPRPQLEGRLNIQRGRVYVRAAPVVWLAKRSGEGANTSALPYTPAADYKRLLAATEPTRRPEGSLC